jgi:hypothetical protein
MPTEAITSTFASEPHDPLLSYAEASKELGISLATFKRRVLPTVPIVRVSPRHSACAPT